ncbi:MAG: hypothetical protein V3T72_05050 [Thermoanaerobaculia bacterium]
MTERVSRDLPFALAGACLLATAGAVSAQTSILCNGEAFIVHEVDAEISRIDRSVDPFVFVPVVGPTGVEINNLGFRQPDGLLYAIELTAGGNNGIITIDGAGSITSLGSGTPALPADQRFDAGDISPDGSTFYVNRAGAGLLYRVTLPALTTTNVAIVGSTGLVFDWAYDPASGRLFGGDSTSGELAKLNRTTGFRIDSAVGGCMPIGPSCTAVALPSGTAFGGAWFNAAGRLFLYQSAGTLFEIDLSGPTIVSTQSGPGSTRNDGTTCVQNVIGAAKQMTSDNPTGLSATYTINYLFENLSGSETLSNLSAIDDLTASFGTHGTDWTFTSISSAPVAFANPGFNGHSATELINQAPTQSLTGGSSATVTAVIELLTLQGDADMNDEFCNQVLFQGEDATGTLFGDLSTDDNSTSDPNADGNPDEHETTCVMQTPVSLMTFSIERHLRN